MACLALTTVSVSWALPTLAEDGPAYRTVVTPSRGEGVQFDAARSVYVLGHDALELAQPQDVPDALDAIPGIQAQRTNRGAAAPILRGLIGLQNLLLIDGIRYDSAIFRTGPNQYAALVAPAALDGVEVLLGPSSALYGSGAMGGTIHYRLRRPRAMEGVAAELGVSFASADLTTTITGRVDAGTGPLSGWLQAGYRAHQSLRVGEGAEVPRSDFEQVDWATRWLLRIASDLHLTTAYVGTAVRDAARTDQLSRGDVRLYDTTDHLGYLSLEGRSRRSWLRRWQATVAVRHLVDDVTRWRCEKTDDGAVVDRIGCIDAAPRAVRRTLVNADAVTGISASLVGHGALLSEHVSWTAGVDARTETVSSARTDAPDAHGTFPDGARFSELAGFAQVEVRPWLDPAGAELVLSGALRGTGIFAGADDVLGIGRIDYDFRGLTGSLDARLLLAQHVSLYVSFAQGFRAPNLQETTALGDTGSTFELPNGDLTPERSETVEFGARLSLDGAEISIAAFRTVLTDAIVRQEATLDGASEIDGKPVVQRVNATKARYVGYELSASFEPIKRLQIYGTLSGIDGDVTDSDTTGPARRVPPVRGSLGVRWRMPRLWLGAEVRAARAQSRLASQDQRDLRICADPSAPHRTLAECAGTPGWATLRLTAGAHLTDSLRANLLLDNVLDAAYRVHGSGYDAPGFDARITVQQTF